MASSSHDLVASIQAPPSADHRPLSQYSNFTTLVGPDSFDAIAHDAELFSMSGVESSVSGTVQGLGLGSTTGHGLMLVGQWAVRGIDALSIEVRLQRVRSVLALGRVARWTVAHAMDLLEYQRIHVYSDRVRAKAWGNIFVMLEGGGWTLLKHALDTWSDIETCLLLRQLSLCQLSKWATNPVKGYPRYALMGEEIEHALSQNYARLLAALLDTKCDVLQETFAPEYLTLLLCETPPPEWTQLLSGDDGPNAALAAFTASWTHWPVLDFLPGRFELTNINEVTHDLMHSCPQVQCFVLYTCSERSQWWKTVVGFLAHSLAQTVWTDATTASALAQKDMQRGNGSTNRAANHPAWLPLWLIAMLCLKSGQLAALFVNAGVLDTVRGLCARGFAFPVQPHSSSAAEVALETACFAVVAAVKRHHACVTLVEDVLSTWIPVRTLVLHQHGSAST